jgi:hypothetical protein
MSDTSPTAASIGEEVTLFTRHVDSLRGSLPALMFLLQEIAKRVKKDLDEFERINCNIKLEEAKKTVEVTPEHYKRWSKLDDRNERYDMARVLVPRSLFVSLVSQYDAFLGRLLRAVFILRPEVLNSSERTFTFTQLQTFASIDDAREFLIDKEVETVLRSSHADQFKWMEQRFDLPLTKGLAVWPLFIELTERRNLFVHTDGVVSRQYITVCQQHGYSPPSDIREGAYLQVPQKYFETAYETVYEIGVKLAHVLWRKLLPDQRPLADENLGKVTYDLIEGERYRLACSLLDFACDVVKKFSNEWHELVLAVNRAQAYKWNGDSEKARSLMAKVDWSAKGTEFKLANAVLSEEWGLACDLMLSIGSDGPVTKVYYRDWPLFKEFRARTEFLETYHRVFGEPFAVQVDAPRAPPSKP